MDAGSSPPPLVHPSTTMVSKMPDTFSCPFLSLGRGTLPPLSRPLSWPLVVRFVLRSLPSFAGSCVYTPFSTTRLSALFVWAVLSLPFFSMFEDTYHPSKTPFCVNRRPSLSPPPPLFSRKTVPVVSDILNLGALTEPFPPH